MPLSTGVCTLLYLSTCGRSMHSAATSRCSFRRRKAAVGDWPQPQICHDAPCAIAYRLLQTCTCSYTLVRVRDAGVVLHNDLQKYGYQTGIYPHALIPVPQLARLKHATVEMYPPFDYFEHRRTW